MGHSQGASYALRCAQLYPEFVRAVVAVEPPCAPESRVSEKLRAPHLFVWGDFIDGQSEIWTRYRSASERYRARLRAAGYVADLLDLPAQGLVGNSHMLIMDRNSDAIGASVLSWLRQQL